MLSYERFIGIVQKCKILALIRQLSNVYNFNCSSNLLKLPTDNRVRSPSTRDYKLITKPHPNRNIVKTLTTLCLYVYRTFTKQ